MPRTIAHDAFTMIEYSDESLVLLVADNDAAMTRMRRAAEAAKCRIADAVGIEEAADRLDRQLRVDAVLVEIEQPGGIALDRLLDRLTLGALHGRYRSVVSCSPELIDLVTARSWHEQVDHLSAPSDAQRVAAVAAAVARGEDRLHDVRRGPQRLQQLSEEVGRIANILASLSEGELPQAVDAGDAGKSGTIDAGMVRAIIRARRMRDQYFHAELFADPAWDMLLDLLAARLEQQRVAVSSLCIAAAVPATTALRWIKTLTQHGLFVRAADPEDGRRVYIELSDAAAQGLEAYLKAAQRISPLII